MSSRLWRKLAAAGSGEIKMLGCGQGAPDPPVRAPALLSIRPSPFDAGCACMGMCGCGYWRRPGVGPVRIVCRMAFGSGLVRVNAPSCDGLSASIGDFNLNRRSV